MICISIDTQISCSSLPPAAWSEIRLSSSLSGWQSTVGSKPGHGEVAANGTIRLPYPIAPTCLHHYRKDNNTPSVLHPLHIDGTPEMYTMESANVSHDMNYITEIDVGILILQIQAQMQAYWFLYYRHRCRHIDSYITGTDAGILICILQAQMQAYWFVYYRHRCRHIDSYITGTDAGILICILQAQMQAYWFLYYRHRCRHIDLYITGTDAGILIRILQA